MGLIVSGERDTVLEYVDECVRLGDRQTILSGIRCCGPGWTPLEPVKFSV